MFTFIDLFAGIGGIRLGFEEAGGTCVFSSEIDKFARRTYEAMFHEVPSGDITKIPAEEIPKHDILVGGFPCQPFSQAGLGSYSYNGLRSGFAHPTKGTLFFEIVRILAHHRPKAFFLENVKHLKRHNHGETWRVIEESLKGLGYDVYDQIYDARLVVPQHRERVFIVGFREDLGVGFEFPDIEDRHPKLKDILEENPDPRYTHSDASWTYLRKYKAKHELLGTNFGYAIADPEGITKTMTARYYKDGSEILIAQEGKNPRKLTVAEAARLQGFPEKWEHPVVSVSQAYKQFGNAVAVPLVAEVAKAMVRSLWPSREDTKEMAAVYA